MSKERNIRGLLEWAIEREKEYRVGTSLWLLRKWSGLVFYQNGTQNYGETMHTTGETLPSHKNTQIAVEASWRGKTVTMDIIRKYSGLRTTLSSTNVKQWINPQEWQRKCWWTFHVYAVLGRLESGDRRLRNQQRLQETLLDADKTIRHSWQKITNNLYE